MKTTMRLSVIIHFDREINNTRAIRDNITKGIELLIPNGELFSDTDKHALVDELNVSIVNIYGE
jgi:hypothetical protein